MEIKPDLYIVAGFSGCENPFLDSTFYSIDKIFNSRDRRIKKPSIETIKYLRKRRSLTDNNLQAMLFCNAFGSLDFTIKKFFPSKHYCTLILLILSLVAIINVLDLMF